MPKRNALPSKAQIVQAAKEEFAKIVHEESRQADETDDAPTSKESIRNLAQQIIDNNLIEHSPVLSNALQHVSSFVEDMSFRIPFLPDSIWWLQVQGSNKKNDTAVTATAQRACSTAVIHVTLQMVAPTSLRHA